MNKFPVLVWIFFVGRNILKYKYGLTSVSVERLECVSQIPCMPPCIGRNRPSPYESPNINSIKLLWHESKEYLTRKIKPQTGGLNVYSIVFIYIAHVVSFHFISFFHYVQTYRFVSFLCCHTLGLHNYDSIHVVLPQLAMFYIHVVWLLYLKRCSTILRGKESCFTISNPHRIVSLLSEEDLKLEAQGE